MTEVIGRYIKTAILFVLIWVATWFWTSCGMRRPGAQDMTPTIGSEDQCWTLPKSRTPETIQNGDIVFFENQVAGQSRNVFVGRVMGHPGERVKMVNGESYVNGSKFDTGFVSPASKTDETFEEFIIPRDSFYILMDNRKWGQKYDSRAYGPFGTGCILAKVKR